MLIPQRLNLGELIRALEQREQDQRVTFDFGACTPTDLHSYRGIYADLAIGFSHGGGCGPTVEEFVKQLRSAVGDTFHGYKGGDFKMGEHSRIWVAERGDSTSTAIFGVAGDYKTILLTGLAEP